MREVPIDSLFGASSRGLEVTTNNSLVVMRNAHGVMVIFRSGDKDSPFLHIRPCFSQSPQSDLKSK